MSRHRDAVAVAVTAVVYGKWQGYASYRAVNRALRENGLSGQKEDLARVGATSYFDVMTDPKRLDAALAAASMLDAPASGGMYYSQDEKGMAAFYTLSFALFGVSAASWYWLYFTLYALSVLTACVAFRQRNEVLFFFLAVVCAHALLAHLLPTIPRQDINVVHGNRFLGIMASVAIFHLMFLILQRTRPTGVSLRTISFTSLDTVPWELLGFLNVRWVLVSGDGVFRNIVRDGDRISGRPDPAGFKLVSSPARVTPRAFFAAAVEPVASANDAATRLFRPEGIVDPAVTSFVEGLGEGRRFDGGGAIELQGRDDSLDLRLAASSSERFLVLNELYYPGWTAEVDGRKLPILATNAVMRGVVVPPSATTLQFRYVSYLNSPQSWVFRISAMLIMLGLLLALRRHTKA